MGILDNAKQVAKAVEEIHNLELYQRVLGLHSDIIELVEENNQLHGENKDLHKKLELRGKMTFKEPFYFQEGDQTPFCPACWETKDVPVHVTFTHENRDNVAHVCPSCKHHYSVPKHRGVYSDSSSYAGRGGGSPWS